jgi:hypothetical protein
MFEKLQNQLPALEVLRERSDKIVQFPGVDQTPFYPEFPDLSSRVEGRVGRAP